MNQSLKKWIGVLVGSSLFLALVGSATAQAPAPDVPIAQVTNVDTVNATTETTGAGARLTYQGRLSNADGTPVTTSVQMTFRLYDDAGSAVYTTTRTLTPINGLFTVDIGGGDDPDLLMPQPGALRRVASIGVSVGSDPEMTPRQSFNTVLGHSVNSVGVIGTSRDQIGVVGVSTNDIGIYAFSSSKTRPALAADGGGEGAIALRLAGGGIQIFQAGVNTKTPVFIHKTVTGVGGNICTSRSYATVIDHPLTNNNPNAILMVTPNYGKTTNGVPPTRGTIGVFYNDDDSCGAGNNNKWVIYNTDIGRAANDPLGGTDLPNNSLFNVMVIVP